MRYVFLLLALLLFINTPAHADIITGLIAWYPFNGGLLDASGNANNGTAVGGLLLTTDRFGTPNEAYEFNGTNSYISIPNSASLASPSTQLTQAAWVEFYGHSLVGDPFSPVTMKSLTTENGFMFRLTATPGLGFGTSYNNWNNSYISYQSLELNQWYHLASVFDGTSVRNYLNGVRVDSLTTTFSSIVSDSRPLTIGADTPGYFEVFYGKIDDVRFYSRALSDDDIAELCDCAPTAVGDTPALRDIAIRRTYPNPTTGDTRVDFVLGSGAAVDLAVYDVAGHRVRSLQSGTLARGDHSIVWDGRDTSGATVVSGVYFIRLDVGGKAVSTRTIRVR